MFTWKLQSSSNKRRCTISSIAKVIFVLPLSVSTIFLKNSSDHQNIGQKRPIEAPCWSLKYEVACYTVFHKHFCVCPSSCLFQIIYNIHLIIYRQGEHSCGVKNTIIYFKFFLVTLGDQHVTVTSYVIMNCITTQWNIT